MSEQTLAHHRRMSGCLAVQKKHLSCRKSALVSLYQCRAFSLSDVPWSWLLFYGFGRVRERQQMEGCTSKESERLHLEGKDSKGCEPFEGCTSEERRCTSREDGCSSKEQTLHLKGKEVAPGTTGGCT